MVKARVYEYTPPQLRQLIKADSEVIAQMPLVDMVAEAKSIVDLSSCHVAWVRFCDCIISLGVVRTDF